MTPLFRHLDAPIRFLSFTLSDTIAYLIPFLLGALLDSLLIVPLLGAVIVMGMKKVFQKLPSFYVIRFLYWSLPTPTFNKLLKVELLPSHKRFWIK